MKKKILAGLATGVFIVGMVGMANASLTIIGTASYGGSDYNLIWDDDNNGNSVIWLDYTNGAVNWTAQNAWAAGLDSALTYNIDSAYTVAWDGGPAWRLGSTVDGGSVWGYDGTTTAGYNITSSEMGHLFYEEFGNLGYKDTSGAVQAGWGLQNTGDFENLIADWYWSGTEYGNYSLYAWAFNFNNGAQFGDSKSESGYGLALRAGEVTSAVPLPGAVWLLGSGLAGLVGLRRKRN